MCPFCIATTASIALAAIPLCATPLLTAFARSTKALDKPASTVPTNSPGRKSAQKEQTRNA
jgi:hypothetical protein